MNCGRLTATLLVIVFSLTSAVAQLVPATGKTLRDAKMALLRHMLALQSGDLVALKASLSQNGTAFRSYRVLLENPTYGDFLRDFYRGSKFGVGKITKTEQDELVAEVIIQFPNGTNTITQLLLTAEDGTWKIVDDVTSKRHLSPATPATQ